VNRLTAALAALLVAGTAAAQEAPVQAPFITTPPEVVARMLELARTGPEDFVIDLGSGDGRIVIRAAAAHGARGLGVDLDERLVADATRNAERAGVAGRVRFVVGDALRTDLGEATVVTAYLLPFLLEQLDPRLLVQLRPGARVVTHAFPLPGWLPEEVQTVKLSQRHTGQGDTSRVYLYVVPAQARGTWRAPGGWQLVVWQDRQRIDVDATRDGQPVPLREAQLRADRMRLSGPGFSFSGRVGPERIDGELAGAGPLAFERAR
jgi:protein-L-isoaspartate O-methyltransferase